MPRRAIADELNDLQQSKFDSSPMNLYTICIKTQQYTENCVIYRCEFWTNFIAARKSLLSFDVIAIIIRWSCYFWHIALIRLAITYFKIFFFKRQKNNLNNSKIEYAIWDTYFLLWKDLVIKSVKHVKDVFHRVSVYFFIIYNSEIWYKLEF